MTYREEIIGDARLILGDCREVLPCLQADAVVTDPVWPNVPNNLLQGWEDPFELFAETMEAMPRVKRMSVVMRSDSDPRFLISIPADYPFFVAQVLQYVMPGYIGRKLGGNEIAYGFGEPIPSRPGQRVIPGMSPKAQPGRRENVGHPCPRAVTHMEWLVRWWSEPEEIVLDPFMGSGTTGVACMNLGRKFIGVEIDPKYFDIACSRIEQAQKQQRLFA